MNSMIKDHVTVSAALGANVGLAGVNGAAAEFMASVHPVLQFLLLALQLLVAGFTAWFLWRKIHTLPSSGVHPTKKKKTRKRRARKVTAVLLAFSVIYLFGGCGVMSPHVKPGHITTASGVRQVQPQDPKSGTSLNTEAESSLEFILPAGSEIATTDPKTGKGIVFKMSEPTTVKSFTKEKVGSSLGAADLSVSKMIAKLRSVRWIQGVGILLILFGIASFVYPPLRVIIGSITTSLVIGATGLALIVLPILVVGHEVMILLSCLGAALGYVFLHRYGRKTGEAAVLREVVTKKWVDKNNDGLVQADELTEVKD